MEKMKIETIEIEGATYILLDTLEVEQKKYFYFSNKENSGDIQILKELVENDEKYFVSLDNETEFNEALILFEKKYKDSN